MTEPYEPPTITEVGPVGGFQWVTSERPPMEIGNVWIHDNRPNQIHYMLHWTDGSGVPQSRHLVELQGSALAKILETRIR